MPIAQRPPLLRAIQALGLSAALALGAVPLSAADAPALANPAAAAPAPAAVFADTRTGQAIEAMDLDASGAEIVTDYERLAIAPGVERVDVSRIGPKGRLDFDVLVADLGSGQVRADYLYPGTVSDAEPVSDLVEGAGAVGGVNGGFFDINNTNAPLGVGVAEGEGLVTIPESGGGLPIVFTEDGLGHVAEVLLQSSVAVNGQPAAFAIKGVNTPVLNDGSVILYTDIWGAGSRSRALKGAPGVEVLIGADGVVASVSSTIGAEPLAEGQQSLVGRGAGATQLQALKPGDRVEITTGVTSPAGPVAAAIAGNAWLVKDGAAVPNGDPAVHPRTAVGFSADGGLMLLVVVDGRQAQSRGLSLQELGELMRQIGSHTAVNLDGGGSSALASVEPGDEEATVSNSPSDGAERHDPNGIGLFVDRGSGEAKAFAVETTNGAEDANRVFPGLHRTLRANAYDEQGAAVAGVVPTWTSGPEAQVAAGADGGAVVTGASTGRTTVTAASGAAAGSVDLDVLGPLERIEVVPSVVKLAKPGDVASLTVYGYDANGFRAPIEASDVEVTGDEAGAFALEPSARGTFTVSSQQAEAGATLTFSVQGETAQAAITVGSTTAPLTDLADAASWTSANDRSPGGSVGPAPGYSGSNGLRMTYDFTQSTATRGQYAVVPNGGLQVPGQPTAITMWVHGDGKGAWLRLQGTQADGTTVQINGPYVNFTGWQQVSFEIASGLKFPITITRIRLLETAAAKSYRGEVIVSDLRVSTPTEVTMPQLATVADPIVAEAGATDDDQLRVAVMSDAQFVARTPDSPQVAGARDALREIVAADPDLLVINGDFVDEASTADFELARKILDEELAGAAFPWIYAPGNHEIMGGAISNFRAAFGATNGSMDLEGTRMIWLDSSTGRLAHDFSQVQMLRQQLDAAAADPAVTGVLVFQHIPIDDPQPSKPSQLSDRLDAEMERDWLEGFRETSGKPIASINGHVGIFHDTVQDGVAYVINGNSGKSPSPFDTGSFTGWTMLGVDPSATSSGAAASADQNSLVRRWLEVETMTRVDRLELGGGATSLAAGAPVTLDPAIIQDGSRRVELEWPVSFAWTSSAGVHLGALDEAPEQAVASFDPATGVLTPLRHGSGTLSLTVNDRTETYSFAVQGVQAANPVIEGTAQVGETLTAKPGAWGPEGVALAYEWLADGEVIAGAAGPTLALGEELAGKAIAVRVTGTAGAYPAVAMTSRATEPVAARPAEHTRLFGDSRYTTAVEVSREHGIAGNPVVLATGESFADALAAGPVAGELDASLLLTLPGRMLPEVEAEIARLKPSRIIVIGTESSVSQAVVDAAVAASPGAKAERIGGATRVETATMLAEQFFPEAQGAFLATGWNFPDALSASAAGALAHRPVLLTTGHALSPETAAYLAGSEVAALTIAGGEPSVSAATAEQAAAARDGIAVDRLFGADRYETSVRFAEAHGPAQPHAIAIATGRNYPDALVASVVVDREQAPLVLTTGSCVVPATAAYLDRIGEVSTITLGSESAVQDGWQGALCP